MPIRLGETTRLTLAELVGAARQGGPSWELKTANAFLLVLLTPDATAGIEQVELTRVAVGPKVDALPGPVTVVIPLKARTSGAESRAALGRSSVCEVFLPFPTLSKVHAYFVEASAGGWRLEDAGSLNGTFLNGTKVVAKRSTALVDGAELKFGDVEATFWLKPTLSAEIRRLAEAAPKS